MKALRNYLDKIKPNFEEGGKFHAFQSVFDGFETFLFVPSKTAKTGTHIHDAIDSKRIRSEERRVGKECRSRWSPYH